jgi:hypothetical protein
VFHSTLAEEPVTYQLDPQHVAALPGAVEDLTASHSAAARAGRDRPRPDRCLDPCDAHF